MPFVISLKFADIKSSPENLSYQLDLVTPGSLPSDASVRKQILQIPAFLINPLGLPHKGHLLYERTANFGVLPAFTIKALLAKPSSLRSLVFEGHSQKSQENSAFFISFSCCYNGNIKTLYAFSLIIINFRKYNVLGDAQAEIAPAIKGFS